MIKEMNCDMLEAPIDIGSQCVNCHCRMASGLALSIKKQYPEVYQDDLQTEPGDRSKLGTVRIVKLENPRGQLAYVANCYAQFNFGTEKRQVNYEAIYKCFEILKVYIEQNGLVLGIPFRMGCGLAGGDWRIVRSMIDVVFGDLEKDVLICKIED